MGDLSTFFPPGEMSFHEPLNLCYLDPPGVHWAQRVFIGLVGLDLGPRTATDLTMVGVIEDMLRKAEIRSSDSR